ncbi:MAG: hypothetical protein RIQ71_1032 [Verrucomicrobiota bacterium]
MMAVCAEHNISAVACYARKRKYRGMGVGVARYLSALEDENTRLKCSSALG